MFSRRSKSPISTLAFTVEQQLRIGLTAAVLGREHRFILGFSDRPRDLLWSASSTRLGWVVEGSLYAFLDKIQVAALMRIQSSVSSVYT